MPSLIVAANGNVTLRSWNGQQVGFVPEPDGTFIGDSGSLSSLTTTPTGYQLVRSNQDILTFDNQGRALGIENHMGKGLALAYSGGNLVKITDSVGREAILTYDDGLLSRVELPDGRFIDYTYTNGLLTSVTDLRGGLTTSSTTLRPGLRGSSTHLVTWSSPTRMGPTGASLSRSMGKETARSFPGTRRPGPQR